MKSIRPRVIIQGAGVFTALILTFSLSKTPIVHADPGCGKTGGACSFNINTSNYTGGCVNIPGVACGCSTADGTELGPSTDCET